MVNILIVDDEIHSVESFRFALDWENLGIKQVFSAHNVAAAQRILSNNEIHIVVTDIEMPKGSGYDLLQWMRENGCDPAVIILTGHGTFGYARQAVEFQCVDYLLKPASQDDILRAVQKALGHHFKRQSMDTNNRLATYWNASEDKRRQDFWREIVVDAAAYTTTEAIMCLTKEYHINYTSDSLFIPVLYKIHHTKEQGSAIIWTDELRQRLYYQVVHEEEAVLVSADISMWVILKVDKEHHGNLKQKIARASSTFINWALDEHELKISCYMGECSDASQTAMQLQTLVNRSMNNIAEKPGVYWLRADSESSEYQRPDIDEWILAIDQGSGDAAIDGINEYLDELLRQKSVDRNVIHQLLHDYMQALYVALDERSIQANLLFADSVSANLFERASVSINDFRKWVDYVIHRACEQMALMQNANSIVECIKHYIKENLSEDLSRNSIAESVYLSADYTSRVFRKETGVHLNEYITIKRMQKACSLLKNTNIPIGEIAYQVGYMNMAYFSRVFRIRNQMTPGQYRENYATAKDEPVRSEE